MSLRTSVFTLALLATASSSMADFSGYYDPSNWTFDTSGDGFVDASSAPASILVVGPNDGSNSFGWSDFFITAPNDGTMSFDWLFETDDIDDADAGVYINGTLIPLSGTNGASGSESVSVLGGDNIGFSVESIDSSFGPGYLTITNFSAPLVPEPMTLGALAAMSVLALRRRA